MDVKSSPVEGFSLVFDQAYDAILTDQVHSGMDLLYDCLADLRDQIPGDEWPEVSTALRVHPVHTLLLESPFTRRAFQKPRGYAGDAELIDLIYACGRRPVGLSTLGECLFSWEFESPGCRSVRHRRMRFAREIDAVASEHSRPSVLALACGHLREADLSSALREGRVLITALDQDTDSVQVVARDYGNLGVRAQVGTVRDVLRQRIPARNIELAYAAGLYDYLDSELAAALSCALFRILAPGGRLLIANFTPSTRDAAYMEACMDWRLVYRGEQEMAELLKRVPPHNIDHVEQFRDRDGNITYLRAVRR